jgi:D-ribulokinase
MMISGGASHSPLVRQIMADTTGVAVALPSTAEPVLLGAAMLGAVAAGTFSSLHGAMKAMSRLGPLTLPSASSMADFHSAKRRVYALMRKFDQESRHAMQALDACQRAAAKVEEARCC